VVAATNGQVAARVTLQIADLVAALATGAVGSVALVRSDISDTLPGVAIAISLVPPLAVVGLTLESGAPRQALAAFLLLTTNVAAIVASGIVVMALYRVRSVSGQTADPAFHYRGAVAIIAALLLAVIVPVWIGSVRIERTTIRQSNVQAVAEHWASDAGWSVVGVTATGDRVLVQATGPNPAPDLAGVGGHGAERSASGSPWRRRACLLGRSTRGGRASGAVCSLPASAAAGSPAFAFTCYTVLRAARKTRRGIMANQNITLSLPEEDLREARVLAARRGTSVSQLLARVLRETVERETGYDAAKERSLALLREGADRGTGGDATWSRDDLHER
jgi:hypothetical protein